MPANVLVIVDAVTQDVLRVVVPDNDAQLDKVTFHGDGEEFARIGYEVFEATSDLRKLKAVAVGEILRRRRL
jgi:hypothetical protein